MQNGNRDVSTGEDCIETVENILRDKLLLTGNVIEDAHRAGRPSKDNPRHVIARFYSRVTRGAVMKAARGKQANTNYRLIDDLTQEDVKEKHVIAQAKPTTIFPKWKAFG